MIYLLKQYKKVNYIITNTVELECSMVWSTLDEILCAVENPGVQQSRHRAPPQDHLRGLQGGDGVEEGVGKILWTKRQGFLRTGAETTSSRGVKAGTKTRSGGRDWGRPLGDLLSLPNLGADLGRISPKGFKPGSLTIGGGTEAEAKDDHAKEAVQDRGKVWEQAWDNQWKQYLAWNQFPGRKTCPSNWETKNSVGATVEFRERLYGGVLSNKHLLSGG